MKPTLTHLALHVRDVEAFIAFYESYCGMKLVHDRAGRGDGRTVWIAEAGREREFVFVLISGGSGGQQPPGDYSHQGFALSSREEVNAIAERAERDGVLAWPPRQEDYPVGYYCGVRDPDGNVVEFSYGQPLGPGAESTEAAALV